jgi:hypothetical protein
MYLIANVVGFIGYNVVKRLFKIMLSKRENIFPFKK